LFHKFNLSTAFLYTDPLDWPDNEKLKNGNLKKEMVKKLKYVHNIAEEI